MEKILEVRNLTKEFDLNKKQMKERNSMNTKLVAVNDLSLIYIRVKSMAYLALTALVKQRH